MLKKYVPASSPMYMFVRHYTRLQFDRESAESFEERRTRSEYAALKKVYAAMIFALTLFYVMFPICRVVLF